MGVFDDKKFEELDWISQATEPIDSIINEVLALIPEEVEIDFNYFTKDAHSYSIEMYLSMAVFYAVNQVKPYGTLSTGQLEALSKCFEFRADPNLILDYETKQITGGKIFLIKTVNTMDEKDLVSLLGKDGIDVVAYNCRINNGEHASRCNEVMEILGKCADGMRTRSLYKKRKLLVQRITQLFK